MVFIPAVEKSQHRSYVWYIGDPIPSTSLWVRFEDKDEMEIPGAEYPIYYNTRGNGIWNSSEVTYGSAGEVEPTESFWEALAYMGAGESPPEEVTEECEWYELECLHSLSDLMRMGEGDSESVKTLLSHARTQNTRNLIEENVDNVQDDLDDAVDIDIEDSNDDE